MNVTTKLMTWQEFAAMPDDGERYELVRGELITMSRPKADHGYLVNKINIPLGYHVLRRALGNTYAADTGFLIGEGPDTVRGPDVSFVSRDRMPVGRPGEGFIRGSPDFLVEVLSPNDTIVGAEEKIDDWLAGGARLAWLVNPRRESVTVYRPGETPATYYKGDTLDAGDVVPGFTLPVADIFA